MQILHTGYIKRLMCYDKVKLWIPKRFDSYDIDKMTGRLNVGKVSEDIKTGVVTMSGMIRGMSLYIRPNGLVMVGSLPKFLYNDNIHPLTRKTTRQAIEALSDAVGFDVGEARVSGLEFGMNFVMSNPVSDYLSRLGVYDGALKRGLWSDSSLYYKSKSKVLHFYDKVEDAKAKGMPIPKGLEDARILRYEMRLIERVSYQLGVNDVRASTLSDRTFYKMLVRLYQSFYEKIDKLKKADVIDMNNEKQTPRKALDCLLGWFANTYPEIVDDYFKALKEHNKLNDRNDYSRFKTMLKEAMNEAGGGLEDELIKELDNDIDNLGAYL
jgi:hypothetical protein